MGASSPKAPAPDGIVLVDKPQGKTSHDIVNLTRRRLGTRQVGHAGTLDPMATGLLVVLVGTATRLASYATGASKTYVTRVTFGATTDSLDADGTITERAEVSSALRDELRAIASVDRSDPAALLRVAPTVVAAIDVERARTAQVPPAVSAIHVDGERAYDRVRRGEVVEIAAREISLLSLSIVAANGDDELPSIDLELHVSKGYYVRSLARDLGVSLGVPAHLTSLRRTKSGGFSVDEALLLPRDDNPSAFVEHTIALSAAISRLMASCELTVEGAVRARQGKSLAVEHFAHEPVPDEICAWVHDGTPIAIGSMHEGVGRVIRGFPALSSFTPRRLRGSCQPAPPSTSLEGRRRPRGITRPDISTLELGTTTLLLLACLSALLGSACAAADASMRELSPARMAGLLELLTHGHKGALSRFALRPDAILSRWLTARVLLAALTAILVYGAAAPVGESARPAVSVLVAGVLHGIFAALASGVARARPATVGIFFLRALRPIEFLVLPLAVPISWLASITRALVSRHTKDEHDPRHTESEVEYLVEGAEKAGEIAPAPAEIIRKVLDFSDLTVQDVMIPRIKVVGVEVDTPLEKVVEYVSQEGHSRYPIYRTQLDNMVGILYAKDVMKVLASGMLPRLKVTEIMRTSLFFVPEKKPVVTVLQEMRSRRQHLAISVDEFGGVSGIVTLEDILELIVGDIRDEHDGEDAPIQELGAGRLLADATVSLVDLSAFLGADIQGDGDYGSLGGLLTHTAGRVPAVGDHLEVGGYEFIVREADARRPIKVEIILPPPSSLRESLPPPM